GTVEPPNGERLAPAPGHVRERLPHLADSVKPEVAAGDANDAPRNAVDGDRAAKDRPSAGVRRLPQAVSEDHHGLRPWLIVVRTEIASEDRRFAKEPQGAV